MLLRNLGLLFSDPASFFVIVPAILGAIVVGITIHEFSHALAARSLGDNTAANLGRLSLNPLAHLDPLGSLMLLLAGFGWGKPVPVDHRLLRNGRRDMAIVSAAGPISNLATGFLAALPFNIGLVSFTGTAISTMLGYFVFINVILAVFNLIPLFPLDGSKIALGILPKGLAYRFARIEMYGPIILILIVGIDFFTRANILWRVMGPAVNFFYFLILGRS